MTSNIQRITRVALATTMLSMAVYAIPPLSLSFLPVPVTLQLLIILILANYLSTRESISVLMVYLLIGALGMPVFSGGRGGLEVLLGPTGGFLLTFPLAAGFISFFKGYTAHKYWIYMVDFIAVFVLIYPLAMLWLARSTGQTYSTIIVSMIPFMLLDLVKVYIAASIYIRIRQTINNKDVSRVP